MVERAAEYVNTTNRPLWLMVAVTKSDLFLDKLSEAESYYHLDSEKDFCRALVESKKVCGDRLRYDSAPVFGTREPFVWGEHKVESQGIYESEERAVQQNFNARLVKLAVGE